MTRRSIALAFSLLVCGACSGAETSSDAGSIDLCPSAPKACPTDAPTYSGQVEQIFKDDCAGSCHIPGGSAPDRLLTNLTQIQHLAGPSLTQTAACNMPPGGAIPANDRAAMLAWLVCGAKDN